MQLTRLPFCTELNPALLPANKGTAALSPPKARTLTVSEELVAEAAEAAKATGPTTVEAAMVDAIASQAVQQKQREKKKKKKKGGREEEKGEVHKNLRETLNEGGGVDKRTKQ
jgi:hypothetical protein